MDQDLHTIPKPRDRLWDQVTRKLADRPQAGAIMVHSAMA